MKSFDLALTYPQLIAVRDALRYTLAVPADVEGTDNLRSALAFVDARIAMIHHAVRTCLDCG